MLPDQRLRTGARSIPPRVSPSAVLLAQRNYVCAKTRGFTVTGATGNLQWNTPALYSLAGG